MGYEDRDAVGNSHCQRDSLLGRYMAIGLLTAKPPFPAAGVDEHPSTVHLSERSESPCGVGEIVLDSGPAPHDLVDRIIAREAEGACVTSSGERTNPPTLEVGDCFFRNLTHAY